MDKAVNEFAARGFRSLGVAKAEKDGPWLFLGVLPLFDPPQDDAQVDHRNCTQMGVEVKMVTGDQLAIARETAKKLGMGTAILDAAGLGGVKREETPAWRSLSRRRMVCSGISRTQVPYRGCAPEARPHRGDDRRRR